MRQMIVATALLLALAGPARAGEENVKLAGGKGLDAVQANCGACHSLDYIQMNSPFPDAKLWEAEVTKMIKVFGAPIEEKDAKSIVEYLSANYGKR